jgi:hypothetical protein
MIDNQTVVGNVLERLAPRDGESPSERMWRFGSRMATIYQDQMQRFDGDADARRW